jgi:fibronectin type 3 domain-containing protein
VSTSGCTTCSSISFEFGSDLQQGLLLKMNRSFFCRICRPAVLLIAGLIAVVSCEADVTLVDPARIELSPPTASVAVTRTTQLTARVLSSNNNPVTGHEITWTSLNPTIASVTNGVVTGIALGTARIRAAAGQVSATATVNVIDPQMPAIALAATSISFVASPNGANPDSQVVAVSNAGAGTLSGLSVTIDYANGQRSGWLAAILSGTTAPATLRLRATTGTLAVGSYQATVSVRSTVAQNSPQQLEVAFQVREALPNPPTNLRATSTSATQIELNWGAPTAGTVTRYRIARRTGSNQFAVIDSVSANTLTYQNTGLAPGTNYDYQVTACNASGCSTPATASATTLPNPPGQPTGLEATAVSTTQIDLGWNAATGNVVRYRIARRTGSNQFAVIDSVSASTLTYHDTGRTPGTQYDYQVSACNAGGCSAPSGTASATTTPSAPSNLNASGLLLAISLSWSASAGNVFEYRIERKTAVTGYQQIATVPGGTTSYSDGSALVGLLYTYRVRACTAGTAGGVCSAFSNEGAASRL